MPKRYPDPPRTPFEEVFVSKSKELKQLKLSPSSGESKRGSKRKRSPSPPPQPHYDDSFKSPEAIAEEKLRRGEGTPNKTHQNEGATTSVNEVLKSDEFLLLVQKEKEEDVNFLNSDDGTSDDERVSDDSNAEDYWANDYGDEEDYVNIKSNYNYDQELEDFNIQLNSPSSSDSD